MKKVFSFFMTLCVMFSLMLPASAAEVSATTVVAGGISIEENATTISPRAVARGSRVVPSYTAVYPAILDENGVGFYEDILADVNTPDTSTTATVNSSLYLRPAETQALIARFKARANKDPDMWVIDSKFDISNDGRGSYGEYFLFRPVGGYAGQTASNGTVTYSLSKNTSLSYSLTLRTVYHAKENLTYYHQIGLPNSGYYYYNAISGSHMSQMVGSTVYLNYT